MDLQQFINRYFASFCLLLFGICSANSQTKTSKGNISIQGDIRKDFVLSEYIDTSKIDLIVLDAPFYMIEIVKETTDFSVIDTFDAVSPITYYLFVDLISTFDIYGDYQPAYRGMFFNEKIGEDKFTISDHDQRYFTESQIDSLTNQYQNVLTEVQFDFLRYNFSLRSKGKDYWLYAEYAISKNILFLSPYNGKYHFDEEYYLLPTPCDYLILIPESRRRKELKRVCKEFGIKRSTLKKKNYQVILDTGMFQVIFIK